MKWPDESGLAGWRASSGQPDLVVKSHAWTVPAEGAGRVVAADDPDGPHRAALGARD